MGRTTFTELVSELDDGQLDLEASTALREVIAKVVERAQVNPKGATGTLTLTVKVTALNERGKVEIEAAVASKLPPSPRSNDVRWADEHGGLALGQQPLIGLPLDRAEVTPRTPGETGKAALR